MTTETPRPAQLTPEEHNQRLAVKIRSGFNFGMMASQLGRPIPSCQYAPGTAWWFVWTEACSLGYAMGLKMLRLAAGAPSATPAPAAAAAPAGPGLEERLEVAMNEIDSLAGRVADLETAAVNWAPAEKETQRPAKKTRAKRAP